MSHKLREFLFLSDLLRLFYFQKRNFYFYLAFVIEMVFGHM